MKIKNFKLERYFAKYEFSTEYLLSSSDCDGFAMKDILAHANNKELKLWENLTLGYTESLGSQLLREAISPFYNNAPIEDIIVGSPGELNFITMNLLLKASDHVIIISPSYQSLYEVAKSIGCEISFWKPNTENRSRAEFDAANWEYDPADLAKLVKENTKLIIINFPHNPTGSYLLRSELLKIVEIAKKQDCYLFSDEMYHKLMIGEMEELPPVYTLYEKGISLWGTSKSFGMAGLRTGWIVSQNQKLIKEIEAYKDYLSICSSAPSEILSIIALNHIKDFLPHNTQKIRKNITLFKEFTDSHSRLFNFILPKAGSTAFVGLNIEESSMDFSERLVQKSGIMTLPAEMFEYDGKYIRVGFGRKIMPEVLEKLYDYLNSYWLLAKS